MITPSNLGKEIAAKKAETEALQASASYHEAVRTIAMIEFRPEPRTRIGFPMGHLCHYALEPNPDGGAAPERLTFAFSTADVVVFGARLAPLLTLFTKQNLEWVAAIDERYANASERPWVGRIDVGHFDKNAR